jgi:hypothetical protein
MTPGIDRLAELFGVPAARQEVSQRPCASPSTHR